MTQSQENDQKPILMVGGYNVAIVYSPPAPIKNTRPIFVNKLRLTRGEGKEVKRNVSLIMRDIGLRVHVIYQIARKDKYETGDEDAYNR